MKYLLAIYEDEKATAIIPKDQMDEFMQSWFTYSEQLAYAVDVVESDGLQPSDSATTVRFADGKPVTSDGPFAETKEQLGGYYIIDVDNLGIAIEWAGKVPSLPMGSSVEIRPIQVFEQ